MQLLKIKHKKLIINITSLIDVLFLLLIFFMVSSTFVEQPGMKLELPKSKNASTEQMKNLILQMDQEEEIVLNGKTVVIDSLKNVIAKSLPTLEEKTIVIKADKTVSHGTIVRVMDLAKSAGLKKIVIATQIETTY